MSDFQDPKMAFPELDKPGAKVSVDDQLELHAEEPDRESALVTHARRELEILGWFNTDADYEGQAAEAVMDLIKVFSGQGHSGTSAGLVLETFRRLASWQNLSPITDNPEEWVDVSGKMENGETIHQNIRNSKFLSKDGGKTFSEYGSGQVFTAQAAREL